MIYGIFHKRRFLEQLFLIFVMILLPSVSIAKQATNYLKPTKLSSTDLIIFNKAFKQSWHSLKLDEYLNASDEQVTAAGYSKDLPTWNLPTTCDGKKIYYFNLAEYFVKDKQSKLYNFGSGYTGSSGTRRLILSIDKKSNKIEILFDGNIIDLVGVESSNYSDCADIFVVMSGTHFQNTTNGEYGIARLSYNSKLKKYQSQKTDKIRSTN